MFHRPLLDVPGACPSFCPTPPSAPTALPMTGIRRSPCATPHGGLQFGHLVESTPLTTHIQAVTVGQFAMNIVLNGGMQNKRVEGWAICSDRTCVDAATLFEGRRVHGLSVENVRTVTSAKMERPSMPAHMVPAERDRRIPEDVDLKGKVSRISTAGRSSTAMAQASLNANTTASEESEGRR